MAGSYLKTLQLAKQLEARAKEATRNRQLAEEGVAAAESAIRAAKKIDANVAKAEGLLSDATNAMSKKDYTAAIDFANRSKEEAISSQNERATEVIESAQTLLNLIDSTTTDYSKASNLIEKAKSAYEAHELEKAVEIAKNCWKELRKILHEGLSDAFSSAQFILIVAKNNGQDVSRAEELLRSARTAMEADNYELALNQTNECLGLVGSDLRESILKQIDETKTLSAFVEEMEIDVSKTKEALSRVEKELEKKQYEKALIHAKQAKGDIERIVKKSAMDNIDACNVSIRAAEKMEAETVKVKEILEEAKNALKESNYGKAMECIRQCKEEIDNAKFQKVLKTISLSRDKFILAKRLGADISEAVELLNKARDSLRDCDYKKALDFADKSSEYVGRIVEHYELATTALENMQMIFVRAEEIGVDTSNIKNSIEEARIAIENSDYKKALELVKKAREETEKAEYERVMETIESSDFYINLGEKIGVDLTKSRNLLELAIATTKTKDYKKAIELATSSKQDVETCVKTKFLEIQAEAQSVIDTLKNEDESSKLRALSEEAGKFIELGDYENAIAKVIDVKNLSEDLKSRYVTENYQALQEVITIMKDMKADVLVAEEMLGQAKIAIDGQDYKKAMAYIADASNEIKAVEKKSAEDLFSAVKLMVIDAKKVGFEITSLRDTLRLAKSAIETSDYRNALLYSEKVKKEAEHLKAQYQSAYDTLTSTALLVAEAKKNNVDVSTAAEKLLAAKSAFEKFDYGKALSLADEARKETDVIIDRFKSARKIIATQEKISIAEKNGIDVTSAKSMLEKATTAIQNKEYDASLEFAEKGELEVETALSKGILDLISHSEREMTEVKTIGVVVTKAELLLKEAKTALEEKKYGDAANFAKSSREELKYVKEVSQHAAKEIRKGYEKINDAESLHVDLSVAKRLHAQAMLALKNHEYSTALDLATKTITEVDRVQLNRISEIMVSFQKIIERAKKNGIDTKASEGLMAQAKVALEKKGFKEALSFAMRSEGELERIELQLEMATKAILMAETKLAEADKIGIPTAQSKELLKISKHSSETGDYVKALEYAIQTTEILHREKERFETEKGEIIAKENIKKMEDQIEQAMKAGIDVVKLQSLLQEAKLAFESKKFDDITKLAAQVDDWMKAFLASKDEFAVASQEASNLISSAKKFGIDVKTAERILNQGLSIADTNRFEALRLAKEAIAEGNKAIEDLVPQLSIALKPVADLRVEQLADAELTITNIGKALIKNIEIQILGPIEVRDLKNIPALRKAGSEKIAFKLKPTSSGEITVTFKILSHHIFNDKEYVHEEVEKFNVQAIEKAAAGFTKSIAVQPEKCNLCMGKIKAGMILIKCACGKTFHEPCAQRAKKCTCSNKIATE